MKTIAAASWSLFVFGCIVSCFGGTVHADHDHSDHHHHHHEENEIENKESDPDKPSGSSPVNHVHPEFQDLEYKFDSLWGRWSSMESVICGPHPDQARELQHRLKLEVPEEKVTWKVSPYYKSQVTTSAPSVVNWERSLYSGGYNMLEDNAFLPWFRMVQSEVILMWHKGSNVLVHVIENNGTHHELLLGDSLSDSHAVLSARFEPGTWLALELDNHEAEGSYSLFSTLLVPGYKREFMERGTEALVAVLGEEHGAMVKRLLYGHKPKDSHHGHSHHHHPEDEDGHDDNHSHAADDHHHH